MRVLIIGCGYIGLALGRELKRQGHLVSGVRRPGAEAQRELEAAGITPIFADITEPRPLKASPCDFDVVVNCVAPKGGGAGQYKRVYGDGTRNLLEWLSSAPPRSLVYTSSTGVYGQDDGSVVTEASETKPDSEAGRVLVHAERLLLDAHAQGLVKPTVLRLAGIYGPGRGYWLRRLRTGEPPIQSDENERVVNMIYQQDVVGAVLSVIDREDPGAVYNVVDDRPVTVREMRASKLFATVECDATSAGAPAPRGSRPRATNKRVSNARLKAATAWKPRYPSFEEGFAHELRASG